MFWQDGGRDIAHWRRTGVEVLIHGHQLLIQGVDLSPLWRWFDRSRSLWQEPVANVFCHCGSGPVADVARVWQDGRDPVALVRYQQRKYEGQGAHMIALRAVMHRDTGACDHGALVMHTGDELITHCRSHDVTIFGSLIAEAMAAAGGWSGSVDDDPPRIRRLRAPRP